MGHYNINLYRINNLFDFEYDFFSDEHKPTFEKLFKQKYAFREIGYPTIGEFKYRLKAQLDVNYDYYKQLWEIELRTKAIDYMTNKDYTETFSREITEKEKEDIINKSLTDFLSSETNSVNSENRNEVNSKASNVGDGMASMNMDYGVNSVSNDVTIDNGSSNESSESNNTTNTNSEASNNRDKLFNETTVLTGKGNIGVTSASDLKKGWMEVTYSLITKIIDDCYDLFLMRY